MRALFKNYQILTDKGVIMITIKNFFAPADLVNVHIPET
jgi:hypothetical protein